MKNTQRIASTLSVVIAVLGFSGTAGADPVAYDNFCAVSPQTGDTLYNGFDFTVNGQDPPGEHRFGIITYEGGNPGGAITFIGCLDNQYFDLTHPTYNMKRQLDGSIEGGVIKADDLWGMEVTGEPLFYIDNGYFVPNGHIYSALGGDLVVEGGMDIEDYDWSDKPPAINILNGIGSVPSLNLFGIAMLCSLLGMSRSLLIFNERPSRSYLRRRALQSPPAQFRRH